MRSFKRYVLALVSIYLVSWSNFSASQGLSLYTENFKPYQFVDSEGTLRGFGIDLVREMFRDADVTIKDDIRMAVWSSAYDAVLNENDSAIFLTVRNKKREELFKWVGPLAPREMWLYKLSHRKDIVVDSLEDAKRFLVGGYKSAQTDYLQELGFPKLDIVLKEELNFKKLLAGRIDLMPSSQILMASKITDYKIPVGTVEKVIIFDKRFEYYLALNKSVSDEIVQKLQAALDKIKKTGRYQEMEKQYLAGLRR